MLFYYLMTTDDLARWVPWGIPSAWRSPTTRRPGGSPRLDRRRLRVALPPGRRVVALGGGRRDAPPYNPLCPKPRPRRVAILEACPPGEGMVCLGPLITTVNGMPAALVKTLTWDQGSEMAAHTAFSLATNVQVYFAHLGTRHQRQHQRPAPRVLPQRNRDHRRPNLPQPRSHRTQHPTTPYIRLPNPSRSLRRPPGKINCFHRLTPSGASMPTASGVQ
jgi:hypothetical protein